MNLDQLPYDCFANIMSLTSPIDASRIAIVSSTIRIAADSDTVWEKFLPSDYGDILSRLLHPIVYSSKKELFFRLCNPHLIDGGNKTFSLEKSSGKKLYMLSARELKITWADNPLYWTWKSFPASRFSEAVELRTIWWLEIEGKINSGILSPNTAYEAYLIVKFADRAYGLDILPSKVSIEVGNVKLQGTVCLHHKQCCLETTWFSNQIEASRVMAFRGVEQRVLSKRKDGWVEIKLGHFYNVGLGNSDVIKMCLEEIKGAHLKGGLIVEGIELRPKQLPNKS